jgi:site-specific DNA-cytosine methylase
MRDIDGKRVSKTELRFDGIAGCLRVPTGGSSRQFVVVIENGRVRSRLLSPREAARLMGLPDEYKLPANPNEALGLRRRRGSCCPVPGGESSRAASVGLGLVRREARRSAQL